MKITTYLGCSNNTTQSGSTETPDAAAGDRLPVMTDAASYGKAAAEWQLSTINDLSYLPGRIPQSSYNRGWVKGAFYIGLERFAETTGNQEYLDLLLNESYENGLKKLMRRLNIYMMKKQGSFLETAVISNTKRKMAVKSCGAEEMVGSMRVLSVLLRPSQRIILRETDMKPYSDQ